MAQIDATTAEVALDLADLDAGRAVWRGGRSTAPRPPACRDVLCEALLVLGSGATAERDWPTPIGRSSGRPTSPSAAGLARWHLRARQELALMELVHAATSTRDALDPRPRGALRRARHRRGDGPEPRRRRARRTSTAGDCLAAATACAEASRRYGLATEPVANLWLAGAHALAGDDDGDARRRSQAALATRPRRPPASWPTSTAGCSRPGRSSATSSTTLPDLLDADDRPRASRAADDVGLSRAAILWALVHTIDDDDLGAAARGRVRRDHRADGLAALRAARRGHGRRRARAGSGDADERPRTRSSRCGARARRRSRRRRDGALADRCWSPAPRSATAGATRSRWLREAEAWFAERGYDRLVRRCRSLLGEAGAPVPRRGRGDSEVPDVAAGPRRHEPGGRRAQAGRRRAARTRRSPPRCTCRPKTVERHLSSLFDRTGVRNRQAPRRGGGRPPLLNWGWRPRCGASRRSAHHARHADQHPRDRRRRLPPVDASSRRPPLAASPSTST